MRSHTSTDGITVWVNGEDGSCLGRFGNYGIDIHRGISEQTEGMGECLMCTHGKTSREDWDQFVVGMKEHHGVDVAPKYMPRRFAANDA